MENLLKSAKYKIKNFLILVSSLKPQQENGIRILMYHRIGNYNSKKIHSFVPPELFKEQMNFLNIEGYNVIPLKTAYFYFKNKIYLPKNSLVLTFDDGYEDNFRFAYPILKRFRFPATIFLITKYIKKKKNLIIGEDEYLNLAQVKEMKKEIFDFGSHTMSHLRLSKLNETQLWKEVCFSKKFLEKITDAEINFICYPYGDYNSKVLKSVKSAKYLAGCSVRPGWNLPDTDFFRLRRTEITYKDDIKIFKLKLYGQYDFAHHLYQLYAKAKGDIVWI
jgi:peptidoglycan/xylan/chitin deacetylase (PgdA/CDA1 family)